MAENQSHLKRILKEKLLKRDNPEKIWLSVDTLHVDKHGVQQPRGFFSYYDNKHPDGDFAPRTLFGLLITTVDDKVLSSVDEPEKGTSSGWVAANYFSNAIRAAILSNRSPDWIEDKKKTSWACFRELTVKEAADINKMRAQNRLLQSECEETQG